MALCGTRDSKRPLTDPHKLMDRKDWQNRGAGHRQRMREKFMDHGLSVFTDDEILEMLFSFGTPRQDCKERARETRRHFGSLAAALEASPDELQQIRGVGPNNIFALRFIHEVARKFLQTRLKGRTYITAADDLVDYLSHACSFLDREVFVVTFLDTKHGIIEVEQLFEGTLSASVVYTREVMKKALEHNAAALVLAHNHPSGFTEPSPEDRAITRKLYLAAQTLDINVLDHIIIGKQGSFFSFADQGIMDQIRNEL